MQAGASSFDRAMWGQLAALGWLGASVSEAQGGVGLEVREIALLLEHAGKRLMPEPLAPALGAAIVLAGCGAPAAALLGELIAGTTVVAPIEADAPPAKVGAGGRINGKTGYVFDADAADRFVTPIDIGGEVSAVAIARDTPGVAIESETNVDGGSVTVLRFEGVAAGDLTVLAKGAGPAAAFKDARDLMRIGYAALLLGLTDEALRFTVQYLKDRKQFGVAIGSFQALQHRCASIYVDLNATRALIYESCRAYGTKRQAVAALGAKAHAADTALHAVKECVQLHGAMGYTDEHNMSLYFRRAMALAVAGGDAASCRRTLYSERALVREI